MLSKSTSKPHLCCQSPRPDRSTAGPGHACGASSKPPLRIPAAPSQPPLTSMLGSVCRAGSHSKPFRLRARRLHAVLTDAYGAPNISAQHIFQRGAQAECIHGLGEAPTVQADRTEGTCARWRAVYTCKRRNARSRGKKNSGASHLPSLTRILLRRRACACQPKEAHASTHTKTASHKIISHCLRN
jgi:hypothetical protein